MTVKMEQFARSLHQSGLMTAGEITAFLKQLPPDERPRDAESLAACLVEGKKITRYQAAAVYHGKIKGLVFGDYRVLDKLGQGGMGVVLKAEHRRMGRAVAVKLLHATAMKDPDAVRRFYQEVRAAAKLVHPNIVTAYDAGEHEGLHYLVMEYVEGPNLSRVIKQHGPLPVSQALDCVLQVARGLEYAHAQGIVHRDVKPSNLLIDQAGKVKILDLGLARTDQPEEPLEEGEDRLTQSGQVMGTFDYMAPEQALDPRLADHRSDIYSLGCTLFRLLTGKPPYEADTTVKVILAHREAPLPKLGAMRDDVPSELDAVFQKMVGKQPEDRYQSMTDVVTALESLSTTSAAADHSANEMRFNDLIRSITEQKAETQQRGSSLIDEATPHRLPRRGDSMAGGRTVGELFGAKTLAIAGCGAGAVVGLVVLWIVLRGGTPVPKPPARSETASTTPASARGAQRSVAVAPTKTTEAGKWEAKPPREAKPEPADDRRPTPPAATVVPAKPAAKPEPAEPAKSPVKPAPPKELPPAGSSAADTPRPVLGNAPAEKPKPESDKSPPAEMPAATEKAAPQPLEPAANARPIGKHPMPADEQQQAILPQVDEAYSVAQARTPADKLKLVKELFEAATRSTKPDEKFALLRRAMELAGEAGDAGLMCEVVDAVGEDFQVDPGTVKEKVLVKFAETAGDQARIKSLIQACRTESQAALADDHFTQALNLATLAYRMSQKTQARELRKDAHEWRLEVERLHLRWQKIVEFEVALKQNAADPAANLAVGRWLCFDRGRWQQGLPYLAKGSDPLLVARAEAELKFAHAEAPPSEAPPPSPAPSASSQSPAPTAMTLADGWWDTAQGNVGKEKDAMLLRAGAWYRLAQAALEPGIARTKVDKRLAEIAKLGRPIPDGPMEKPAQRKPSLGERLLMPAGAVAPFSAEEAQQHQQRWAKYLRLAVEETNSIGVKLVLIPAGEFDMGSSPEEIERLLKASTRNKEDAVYLDRLRSEGPRHRVKISKPFYLSACEVTRAEYWRVMGPDATASRPSAKAETGSLPMDSVGWLEAVEFCRRLSALPEEKAAGRVYRLSTEAEWEYACRAGTTGPWSTGEATGLPKLGWFHGNATSAAHAVGQKQPNPWGLHDMHGNVYEWCADWFAADYYSQAPSADPTGPPSGVARILRGGSWRDQANELRAAERMWAPPMLREANIGFRVLREL